MPKNAEIYYCESCDFECRKKSNYDKHLLTRKHKIRTNSNEKNAEISKAFMCTTCGKSYASRSSLWYHNKKCNHNTYENKIIISEDKPDTSKINSNNDSNDLLKDMLIKVIDENKELRKTVQDMIPKIGNTTNNITNKFNMNIFLNEECKDALNLMEFVDSLKIQMEDLVNTGKTGFVNGITNIFIRGLRELEMHKRPLHCSDLKREVLYVKDNDTWEKENENKDKISKAINSIKRNNMQQITSWIEENEDTVINDKEKSDEYLQILQQSLGGNEDQQDKNIQKIIKNVAKEVCISKKIENDNDDI
jgi:hypothetical protein